MNNKNMKKCKTCGAEIANNAIICPSCGAKNKEPFYKSAWFYIIAAFGLIFILVAFSNGGKDKNNNGATADGTTADLSESTTPNSLDTVQPVEDTTPKTNKETEEPEIDPIVGEKTVFKDLTVGEIGKKGKTYVGLQYVKTMPYLPTTLGREDVPADHEVILGFFEFYNGSDNVESVNPEDISCYVDGTQVNGVKTYIKVLVDGVKQFYNTKLDGGCQLLSVQDFEAPKGWSEIKFFYKSDCVWTISPDQVFEGEYQHKSLFDVNWERPVTVPNSVVYTGDYEVQFIDAVIYRYEGLTTGENYIVFKFHITNNMGSALDTSLMGHDMRAYFNNSSLGDATFTMTDKVDGYINIFSIDSIESGMSSDAYVAFEVMEKTGNYFMAYDDGYVSSHLCAYVNTNIE